MSPDPVKYAILNGYRHIDCARMYLNEDEVGRALNEVISSGAVKREELFITSKCWNTYHDTANVRKALQQTLESLQLDYVDLYLIHWPQAYQPGDDLWPKDAKGQTILVDTDYLDTWRGMEQVYKAGLAKAIGVSNFNSEQIDRILKLGTVRPVCNQVECHPYLTQDQLINFCKSRDICVVAYSPLGCPDHPKAKPDDPSPLKEPKFKEIAAKYGKSIAQILVKFQAQRGVVVIPKSVTPSRIDENIDVFDFTLSDDEMKTIASFNRGHRYCWNSSDRTFKYHPFNIPF